MTKKYDVKAPSYPDPNPGIKIFIDLNDDGTAEGKCQWNAVINGIGEIRMKKITENTTQEVYEKIVAWAKSEFGEDIEIKEASL
jgi:hypothetical protein